MSKALLILLLKFFHKSWLCLFPKPTLSLCCRWEYFKKVKKQDSDFLLFNTEGQEGRHYTCQSISFCKKRKWTLLQYVALSGKVICSNSGRSSFNACIDCNDFWFFYFAMISLLNIYRRFIIPLQKKLPEILVSFVRLADVLPNLNKFSKLLLTPSCIF